MKTVSLDEYRALMKAQGVPREYTAFRCPMCKSAADLLFAGGARDGSRRLTSKRRA